MNNLKVCVIGTGSISDMHFQSYVNNPDAVVYGVYDYSKERAEEKAKKYEIARIYNNLEEVYQDTNLDAISICTWNNTHADISINALKSGKHVLVEKPLSMTVEEALKVQEATKKYKKILQVGFVRRFATNTKVLKSFIDKGALGEIYYAKATYLRRLGNPGGWFADKERSGGGPLMDLGIHIIDLCWYLMGRPKVKSISGTTYNHLGNRGNVENLSFYKAAEYEKEKNTVEDMANALITFENGSSLMADVSFTLHAKKDETQVKLFGTKGGAELEPELVMMSEENNTILNIHPQIDHLTFDFSNAFQNEIDSFVTSCLTGMEPIAPVEDGIEVMKIITSIYESSEKKRVVTF
ncbi:Gfo/Idh/MocA family oxidoreductase (plasmid) [Alkalihalophilus pseudofirmus]|uniref:Gfo/Idh/MocA family protein n=1 Tax=Alkalihalophilus pseudofirmus TaxID=79885 RepID=UPI00259AFD46|nr:Gfo/Idh/MocA family oxidoreductase [Alkalihalophilus pseudofirmus]WEG19232.1 Gfo/Idh/MocA family oxidoreductase [Alkalihalophilus pseudofirmus]